MNTCKNLFTIFTSFSTFSADFEKAGRRKDSKLSLKIGEGLPTWRETDIRRKELRIFACFPLHKDRQIYFAHLQVDTRMAKNTGKRLEGMWKIFIKGLFHIFLLSFVPT